MLKTIPLYCTDSNGSDLWIEGLDILFIDIERKTRHIMFHTVSGVYRFNFNGALETCLKMLQPYGFDELDSGNVVNMSKILNICHRHRNAYFDNVLHTSVSIRNMYKVKHIPKK